MTLDEAKTLLIEQGAKMVDARVRGFEAEVALVQAGDDWIAAATDLAKAIKDSPDVSAAEQYECFVTGCALAGVDSEHPGLEEERETFRVMRASGLS